MVLYYIFFNKMSCRYGCGLTDKQSDGGSNTTGVSTQSSANAYLRSSRRYTVLRSKGTWINATTCKACTEIPTRCLFFFNCIYSMNNVACGPVAIVFIFSKLILIEFQIVSGCFKVFYFLKFKVIFY